MKGLQGIFAGALAGVLCFASASAQGLQIGAEVFHLSGPAMAQSVPGSLRGLNLLSQLPGGEAGATAAPSIVPDLLTSLSFAVQAPKIADGVRYGAAVVPVRLVSVGTARFRTPQPVTVGESLDQASPVPLHFDFGDPSQRPAFQQPQQRPNLLGRLLGAIRGAKTTVQLETTQQSHGGLLMPLPPANDQVLGGTTNISLRTGGRTVTLGLSSRFEHRSRGLISSENPSPTLDPTLGFDGVSRLVLPPAAFNNLTSSSVGASLAVPVSPRFTVGLGYRSGTLVGTYGSLSPTTLSGNDSRYFGKLTYTLPHAPATLTFQARQYRFNDNLQLTPNETQLRAGVDLTIKF
uniref:Uncharacterized protein n=1 Tax=mine drainage metagenome TaxID=410659 RepID=E6Q3L0_9ZZZZ